MEKKKTFRLSRNAQRVLLYTLPLLVFAAYALTLYVALSDGSELLRQSGTVLMLLETLSRFCLCVALGTILADYAEKKRA